ncbi:MAG: phosphatase PAP2 family protein [Planctomycetota bacterium]
MLRAAPPKLLDARAGTVAAWQARARWHVIAAISMPIVALLHIFDEQAFHYFLRPMWRVQELQPPGFFLPDWYQVLRQAGNLELWIALSIMLWGVDAHRLGRIFTPAAWRRGWLLLAGSAGAGILAEIMKLIVARERPITGASIDYQGYVHHIPLIDPLFLGQGNLGFPSSHAAVAFGAAITLARLIPGTLPVMIFLALGCGWTRMLMGAHFLTDVAGGAALAWIWVTWLRPTTRMPAAHAELEATR